MGSVYNRGTRRKPNWYVSYKDQNGKRRSVASRQPTKALARRFLERIEVRIANGQVGIARPKQEPPCSALMEEWLDGLRNRAAPDDQRCARRQLVPTFGEMRLSDIDLATVMRWLDGQRVSGYAEPSIRKHLSGLSRFFGWAIERGLAESNPVRLIPANKRPAATSTRREFPWLQDERVVHALLDVLVEPTKYMLYLGNRSGMRTGELVSLRLSDFDYLNEGVIRVRYSHDGPLKEDKRSEGKVKWVPAADDCAAFLAPWLEKRRSETDDPEHHVFPATRNPLRRFSVSTLTKHWDKARKHVGVELTWYQATRHSFASRLSAAGVPIDEIADALGHSSPAITRQHYDHYIRRSYSGRLRGGLGFSANEALSRPAPARRAKQLQVIGVLGDIHSQDARLACALEHLRKSGVERILSVGDIVDGPGDLARTCEQLGADDIDAVRGNHERWLLRGEMRHVPHAMSADELGADERRFLEGLPVVREYATAAGPMLLCHGLGLDDMAGIGPDDTAEDNAALQALIVAGCYRIVIGGHTHRRMVRRFGPLMLINAGALVGRQAGFARIDFAAGEVAFFDLRERNGEHIVEAAERIQL